MARLALPLQLPGDALRQEAVGPGRPGRGEQVAGALVADSGVAFGVVGDLPGVVGKIGELMDDHLRSELIIAAVIALTS